MQERTGGFSEFFWNYGRDTPERFPEDCRIIHHLDSCGPQWDYVGCLEIGKGEPVRGLWAGQPTSPGPGVFAAEEQARRLLSAGCAGRRPDARKGTPCRGHAEGWKCGAAQGVPLEVLREIWYTVSQKIIDRLGTCRMRGPSLHTAFFMEERK